jgi:colanic acid/amylovoran biosynthesis glycosyltransferase
MRVAHVVRRYGGVTEPFIEQRISAPGQDAELWFERSERPIAIANRQIVVPALVPGGIGDRLFHRLPSLARLARGRYASAERTARPDVIHAHYLTTGHLVAMATTSPLVVSTYGFDVTLMPRRRLWRRAFHRLSGRVRAVLVEGPFMRATVEQLGIPADRIEVVPIAANLDGIAYREPGYGGGPLRILMSGRMVEKKGHDLAIRAFAEAAEELPPASTLDLVGDGPFLHDLRKRCARLAAAGRIRFLGAMPRADYLAVLAASDLVLAPSRTATNGDGEGGAPTTILDAQATGVVVLGSTHADIPFLIEDGVTGYLCGEDDVSGLVAAMLRAVSDVSAWPKIAERARRQVEERHSDAFVAARLADIHARAVGT